MSNRTILSKLSLALVGLVSQEPMSGYDVRKLFETTSMGTFSRSPGAIYPALARLEREGLIEGMVENPDTLRPKKVYSVTDEGRTALRETCLRPVTRDDVIWSRDDLMLRFVFMNYVLEKEEQIRFLEQWREAAEAYAEEVEAQSTLPGLAEAPLARFALEHGLQGFRMEAKWTKRVLRHLRGE
jgi:DNA-binding PadR family transcriptional regulator